MILINNLAKTNISEFFLKTVAKIVLKGENIKKKDISIVLVKPTFIKKLNKKYRKINQPTDVLAFGENSKLKAQTSRSAPCNCFTIKQNSKSQLKTEKLFDKTDLGEIVICLSEVKKNAEKYNLAFKKELTLVLVHGILHLLGYEHEKSEKEAKKMRKREEYYLSQI